MLNDRRMFAEKPRRTGESDAPMPRPAPDRARSAAITRSGAAFVRLDAQLFIQSEPNPQVLTEIEQIGGVSIVGGRLNLDDPLAVTRIRAFIAQPQLGPFARIVVKSPNRSWPVLVELSRVSDEAEARFIDVGAPIRLDGEGLQCAFRLSAAEILTAEFIVNGKRPTEIARQRAVAVSTVRTHIANLFSKTSTNRQPELAVLLSFFKQ